VKTTNGTFVPLQEFQVSKHKFTIYPNPANNKVTVFSAGLQGGETCISIIDITGKLMMKSITSNVTNVEIDLSNLSTGLYFVKMENHSGIEAHKLIVE
jgi:hypothetical protein